ncbi:septum site-determining protein MinC [Synechococcus sp. M16CYN]|uniref:septum site-determining protein MinC n=1 Tax=Synechococcus sp. M16CYN TaxID=3103139 RepID=UPI00324DF726
MRLQLPDYRSKHWQEAVTELLDASTVERVDIDCGNWLLNCTDLQAMIARVHQSGRQLGRVISSIPETVVSASALGLEASLQELDCPNAVELSQPKVSSEISSQQLEGVTFHFGTLRSGDHFQSDRSVLVYGDVNPGAVITASGDISIWGRLRGVAHAGAGLDRRTGARIVAMQLRPLQLRIADVVARGPEDFPQPGLAEQATLIDGVITIEPAEVHSLRRG